MGLSGFRIERRNSLTLADNSRIQLNSRSAPDVHFDQQECRLFLHSGKVLVKLSHCP